MFKGTITAVRIPDVFGSRGLPGRWYETRFAAEQKTIKAKKIHGMCDLDGPECPETKSKKNS